MVIWRSPSALRSTTDAQAAPDQALDLDRAAVLLAGRCLAPCTFKRGARQHAVFGGDPAARLALEPGRQAVLERRGNQHMGVAEADEARSFRVFNHAAFERDRAQFVGLSAARPHKTLPRCGAGAARAKADGAPSCTGGRKNRQGCQGRRGVRAPRPAVFPRPMRLETEAANGQILREHGSSPWPATICRLVASQLSLGSAQRTLARDLSPDRRELSGDRRAGRLAQSVAHPADDAVAGVGAQRHVRSGAARPRLCAAYLGRAAADRVRAALLRRCPDAGRRSRPSAIARRSRRRSPAGPGEVGRVGADRSVRASLRAQPRRRRRADREVEPATQAHRVRPARARARARGARRRGRPGRKSCSQYPGRPADVGADRGRRISSTPASAAALCPRSRPRSKGGSRKARPSSTRSRRRSSPPASPAGRAAKRTSAS